MKAVQKRPSGDAGDRKRPRTASLRDLHAAIEEAGRKKQFGAALQHFCAIENSRLKPTSTSYLKIIKACVRCGDPVTATSYYQQMQKSAKDVTDTTKLMATGMLVSGWGDALDMPKAYEAILELIGTSTTIPSRIFSQWLRGALKVGWVFESLWLATRVVLDSSCVELLMELLRGLHSLGHDSANDDKVRELMADLYEVNKHVFEMKASVAEDDEECQNHGKLKIIKQYSHAKTLLLMLSCGFREHRNALKHLLKELRVSCEAPQVPAAQYGEQDYENSIALFSKHKLESFELEYKRLTTMPRPSGNHVPCLYLSPDAAMEGTEYLLWSNRSQPIVWSHIYDFEAVKLSLSGPATEAELPKSGDELRRHAFALSVPAKQASEVVHKVHEGICRSVKKHCGSWVAELGAGDGDWALSQAIDSGEKYVVVNELRWNRVVNTRFLLSRAKPKGRIIIIGGDGTKAAKEYLQAGACKAMQINYPEPPAKKDEGAWLSQDLLRTIHGSLRATEQSVFTLVSDQRQYMEYLSSFVCKPLVVKEPLFECLSKTGPWFFEEFDNTADTYFARLWRKTGKKSFRCVLKRLA